MVPGMTSYDMAAVVYSGSGTEKIACWYVHMYPVLFTIFLRYISSVVLL